MRRIIFFICFLFIGASACSQKKKDTFLEKNLFGHWKVIRVFYGDDTYMAESEQLSCNNEGIYFSKDSIVSSMCICMNGSLCLNPKYSYSKMKTIDAYEGDTAYIKKIKCTSDVITLISAASCQQVLLDHLVLLPDNRIVTGSDNYTYILQKQDHPFNFNLTTIKASKSFLYTTPSDSAKTNTYLIKEDEIEVLENKIYWFKVKYISQQTGKITIGWIKREAL